MADTSLEVTLRVLSQLADPHGTLLIGPLPVSCTVAELKQKIRDLLPSAPPPDRQRLIFRGRPLSRDTDTLLNIFGDELVRQGESQTLHLVLREPPVYHDGHVATALRPPPSLAPMSNPPQLAFPPGNGPSFQLPPQPVLQQTPFGGLGMDQMRRQSSPRPAQVAQHIQQAHLAHMRQPFPHHAGPPLPHFQLPGVPPGQQPVPGQQPTFFAQPLPQTIPGQANPFAAPLPAPFALPFQPTQQFQPFQSPQQHQPFQPPQQFQAFQQFAVAPQHVVHNFPLGPLPHTIPPPRHPVTPQQADQSPNLSQQQVDASTGQQLQSQNEQQDNNGQSHAPAPGVHSSRNVNIPADNPQAAMLGYMESLYASMGIPQQERERLRGEMTRNFGGQQQGNPLLGSPQPTANTTTLPGDSHPPADESGTAHANPSASNISTTPASGPQARDPANGMPGASTTRHTVGPNGARWSMTINAAAMPFPPQVGLPVMFQPPNGALPMNFMPNVGAHVVTPLPPQHGSTRGWFGPTHAIDNMQRLQATLLALSETHSTSDNQSSRAQEDSSPPSVAELLLRLRAIVHQRNIAQSIINAVLSGGPPAGHVGLNAEQVSILQSLSTEFRRQAESLEQELEHGIPGQARGISAHASNNSSPSSEPQSLSRSQVQSGRSSDVVAYPLSSPTGPHAVVYTPQGAFTSTPGSNHLLGTRALGVPVPTRTTAGLAPPQPALGGVQAINAAAGAVAGVAAAPPIVAIPAALQQQLVLQQPVQALQQAQAANADADGMVVALTPFFRTAWFFTRVLAFFWLFGGIGGTAVRRVLIVTVLSIFYHFYQVGAFTDYQTRLMLYWERLIGVHDPARPAAGAAPPGEGPLGQNLTQRLQPGGLSPEEAARRLIGERRQRDRGWLRERARVVERAVALFIASLYPGVGERHVAERERVLREAEAERARVAAAAVAATEAAASNTPMTGDGSQSGDRGDAPAAAGDREKTSDAPVSSIQQSSDPAEGSSSSVAVRAEGEGQLTERRRTEQY